MQQFMGSQRVGHDRGQSISGSFIQGCNSAATIQEHLLLCPHPTSHTSNFQVLPEDLSFGADLLSSHIYEAIYAPWGESLTKAGEWLTDKFFSLPSSYGLH